MKKPLRSGTITRRDLLRYSTAAGATSLLVACLPQQSTPAASETPQTAGRYQLGKLEGPEVITDAAKFPKTFKEAPELAALVQQGKLPKVEDRIGQDPLVLKPITPGKYGGTMHRAFYGGSAAAEPTIHRFATGPGSLLYVDYRWTKIVPNIARGYEMSADAKTVTVQLRRGMKWSDGNPFTADDILFWYEDIYLNKQLFAGASPDLQIAGKDVKIEKVDQYTVRFVSPEPNPLMPERLASPLSDVGGPLFRGDRGRGGYAPRHYLSKFHPKYAAGGQAAVDKMAADAKFTGWIPFFLSRNDHRTNVDLPVLSPWIVTIPQNTPNQFVMQRNPYSIWVDTDGNQLPYIGTLQHAQVDNLEVVALRATAGEYDFQEYVLDVSKLPVLIDNQTRGNYKVSLDPEQSGLGILLNLSYDEDPEIGEWIRNVDFRRALSMGIDRDQINETFFLGTGIPSSPAPVDDNKFFPGKEWRTKWHTLDVAQANALLDKIGLSQKDPDGYRLRKDGKGRLRLSFMAVARITDFPGLAEMVKRHWQKIGIELVVDTIASALAQQRIAANQAQMTGNNAGTEDVFLFTGTLTPGGGGYSALMGQPYALWYSTGGKQGKEPFPTLKQAMDLLEKGKTTVSEKDRIEIGKELYRLHIDNVFLIGLVAGDLASNAVRIAKTNLGNVPGRMLNTNTLLGALISSPQTFYFK